MIEKTHDTWQRFYQRRIVTPAMVVSEGADYIVVGRQIRDAADPVVAAGQIAAEIDDVLGLG